MSIPVPHGRGAGHNPKNRLERLDVQPDPEAYDPERPPPATQLFRDASRTLLSRNESPDLGMGLSINHYRGCEHGCIYCYARPFHEYLSLSAGLDFETKIFVKEDAPELLRKALSSPKWVPETIMMCGVTDPYQPVERKIRLTRRCLEVLAEFRNPVAMITKNAMVTRDVDVLSELSRDHAAHVTLSITTLDGRLQRRLEPRASTPQARLEAMAMLRAAGVPVGVNIAPVIPGLTDHEVPAILKASREAGATSAGMVMVRLPHAVAPLFEDWLAEHEPLKRDKVLNKIKSVRGGKLYDATWGRRMRGEGPIADQIWQLFEIYKRRCGFKEESGGLSTAAFRRVTDAQGDLFG